MSQYRTELRSHACGELRPEQAGEAVRLLGWVDLVRRQGGIAFISLRDRYGIVQIACHPEAAGVDRELLQRLHAEDFIAVDGVVRARPDGMVNADMATGAIEVEASGLELISRSARTPIVVGTKGDLEAAKGKEADEERRLEYRFLDLRRPSLQRRLMLRHKICSAFRRYLDEQDFIDVETPILTLSTPEGARDYLVPSRLWPGSFYALPQSPQIFKQLLMVAGLDRYYQIVRCFRDEDLRKDRQPEFTQLDVEMCCVSEEDVLAKIEGAAIAASAAAGFEVQSPFPRMTYQEAMASYGTDKPDTRFGLLIQDVADLALRAGADFLSQAAERGAVRAIGVPGGATRSSRKELDQLNELARQFGGGGVAWLKVKAGEQRGKARVQSPLAKFFEDDDLELLLSRCGADKEGDLVLLVADQDAHRAATIAGEVRLATGQRLGYLEGKERQLNFLFTVEFPLFEKDPDNEGAVMPTAHPFTGVHPDDVGHLDTDPSKVRGRHYDLVLNGTELGSGSIRIHQSNVQAKIFEILGLSVEEQRERFGFLLEAFTFGAPPHGGFALGIDRFVQLLAGGRTIRDVIAFPKMNNARCPMTRAPSRVDQEQVNICGLELRAEER